jgi:simple sugar transport system ATP-binding protein
VAIGRAVGWSRRIVFLDEPTAALGVRQTRHVLDLIARLRQQGIAVVLITHNMEQVLEICDRVLVMRLGRLVADEPVANLDGPTLVGYVTGLKRAEAPDHAT